MESKVVFFSKMHRPKAAFAPSSDGTAPVYEERLSKSGTVDLVEVGRHNINEFVQTSLEGTLVYNILDRFALGDTSVLEKVKGFYADTVSMPTSLLEVHNFMKSLDARFDSLPVEVKEKFGNSAEKFMLSIENGEFTKIFSEFAASGEVDPTGDLGDNEQ